MRPKRCLLWILASVAFLLPLLLVLISQSKGGQTLLGLFALNDTKIVFYGKLEDQFGNALGNTPVDFEVRVRNGFRSGVDRGTVVSEANGRFIIAGYHGSRLFLIPKRPGYAIASENRSWIYSKMWPENERAHADPNRPIILKMWAVFGPEPLVEIGSRLAGPKRFAIPFTNGPILFDAITGTLAEHQADLAISVKRPSGTISSQHPQEWSVNLQSIDGGIMDEAGTATITYFAPEVGYQPSLTISSTNRLLSGGDSFSLGLYLKSRNGQVYSKIRIGFVINKEQQELMQLEFSGVANTNGSRNWEGAPGTYLSP